MVSFLVAPKLHKARLLGGRQIRQSHGKSVSLSLSYRYTGHRVTRCFALKSKVFRHCTSAQSSTARIRQSHGKSVSLSLSMYSGHRVTRCFALLKAKSSDTARFNIEFTLILQLAEESCNLQRKCWHFVKYAINQRGQ